jgi:TolC family type I secretion outer membrane protein
MLKQSLMALAMTSLFSVSAQAMTLFDAYQLAQAKDAKLASSQAKFKADSELTEQAFAQFLPQVTASMSTKQEVYQLPKNPLSFDERTNNRNVQVTQALYNRQALYAYDQAGLKVDYAKLRLSSANNELGIRLAQTYLNVLLAQENVQLSEQQVKSTEQRLQQVTAALKVGYSTKVDHLSLIAELDDAKAKLTSDSQQLAYFKARLQGMIGQAIPDYLPWPSLDVKKLISQFINPKSWVNEAEVRNLDVQMQQVAVQVAQQEIEIRRSAFYPTVNLGAYYSDADGATYFAQKNDNKVIYLEMKLPLYQGGYDQSRIRESQALLRTAEHDERFARIDAQQRAQEQLSAIYSAQDKHEALTQAILSGESYVASVEEGYRLGVRNIAELSRAKEKLFLNKRDQIRNSVELLNALVILHAVAGQLDDQSMKAISQAVW